MIASWEYRADRACSEYGSHGRSMPKPSIPGIGKRFSSRLTTNMNPRQANAAKKPTFEGVDQARTPGTRDGAATTRAHKTVPIGATRETSASQTHLRMAEWS